MNIITKSYESLLPFLVVEAISAQANTFNSMSVKITDQGWAWLVSARKLFIWKYKESKPSNAMKTRRMLSPCFELQLPQSDLDNRADLIQTFFMPQNPNTSMRAITVPAAVAVSPEGTIRFWSNIANERFTESSVTEMQGQEFCTLIQLSSLEYLIATTTGSVFVLNIDVTAYDAKSVLVCTALSTPGGLLSGLGRRVTNLFFGQMNQDIEQDSRRPLIAVPRNLKKGSYDKSFFVMSSMFRLRQWARLTDESGNSTNELVMEWNLQRSVFVKLVEQLGLSESDYLNFWPIDLVTTNTEDLIMLVVSLDTTRNNAINYATCVFNPYHTDNHIIRLTVLQAHSLQYSNQSEEQLMSLRFLEREVTNPVCYMYDRKLLSLVKIDEDILDALDYANQDDGILGVGIVDSNPILFTQRDGFTSVSAVKNDRSQNEDSTLNKQSQQQQPTQQQQQQQQQHQHQQTQHRQPTQTTESKPIQINTTQDVNEIDQSTNRSISMNTTGNSTLNNSSMNNSKAANELELNKELEWIRHIESRDYASASETLYKLAQESESLKDMRETLLATSKLCKLAE